VVFLFLAYLILGRRYEMPTLDDAQKESSAANAKGRAAAGAAAGAAGSAAGIGRGGGAPSEGRLGTLRAAIKDIEASGSVSRGG
jgi:hypothetical protein